jgi:hypothetical protein
MIKRAHRSLSDMIGEEISARRFCAGLDPDDAAYLILALIQGLAMRWSLNARNFDLVKEGDRLLSLQLKGFENSQLPPA